ncbi:MAG: hypothetical protein J7K89_02970, partial [Candidatus Cloacimonetes bacterium]|nr:hypothetical protein [Candidatus Cloacimonadota bacterium]
MDILQFEKMTPFELGETGQDEAIPFLIKYLRHGTSNEKKLAASGIKKLAKLKFDVVDALPDLINNTSNDSPQTRQYSLSALQYIP